MPDDANEDPWYITDWDELYETNKDGRRWEKGQLKRATPMSFVRLYTFGPKHDNMAYTDAAEASRELFGDTRRDSPNDPWPVAFALFCKLLEIAAHQKPELRGYVLGRRGSPTKGARLQRVTCFSKEQIELGLRVLSDPAIGWIERRRLPGTPPLGETRRGSATLQKAKAKAKVKEKVKEEGTASKKEGSRMLQEQEENPSLPSRQKQHQKRAEEQADFAGAAASLAKAGNPDPSEFARHMILKLGVYPNIPKQLKADRTTFIRVAQHIAAGHVGPKHAKAVEACYRKAADIAANSDVVSRGAYFVTWFKRELESRGYQWDGEV